MQFIFEIFGITSNYLDFEAHYSDFRTTLLEHFPVQLDEFLQLEVSQKIWVFIAETREIYIFFGHMRCHFNAHLMNFVFVTFFITASNCTVIFHYVITLWCSHLNVDIWEIIWRKVFMREKFRIHLLWNMAD